jgi:hypothetical protein
MLQPLGHFFHSLILTVLLVAPIGVLSNKGLVPLIGIMGAWALFNAARDGQLREVFSGFLPLWVFGFSIVGILTAPWAINGSDAVVTSLKIAGLSVTGLALRHGARVAPTKTAALAKDALVVGFVLADLILTAGTFYLETTKEPLWGSAYEMKRAADIWIAYARLTPSEAVLLLVF